MTVWFATFEIKEEKEKEFYDIFCKDKVTYETRNEAHSNGVDLLIWDENESFFDKLKPLCTELSASEYSETGENIQYDETEDTEWVVFNKTDGILLSRESHKTKEEAQKLIDVVKEGLREQQGYYFTSNQERIPVDDVQFEIQQVNEEGEEE